MDLREGLALRIVRLDREIAAGEASHRTLVDREATWRMLVKAMGR